MNYYSLPKKIIKKLCGIIKLPTSPIFFQSLEIELTPVVKYLKGNVLNAGCGELNINNFLLSRGAISVENCDIKSSIPGVIICDLTQIPKSANTYDSVLCNAVLEHVQSSSAIMKELSRVLKNDGNLIICAPFLQPYHPSPQDYQRFTKSSLIELAKIHGFKIIEIFPVHSLAQTISWILWESLKEKNNFLLQILFYFPLYIWCRISQKTDFSLINNANAYQLVLKKSG